MRQLKDKTLLVATHNRGKLEEIEHLLSPLGTTVIGAMDLDLPIPDETACDFIGNARLKAQSASSATGLPALSDDSGLEIDALNGAPGVHTADWAETGSGRDFVAAMTRAHQRLEDIAAPHPRRARFCCALALIWPDKHEEVTCGTINGELVWPMRGDLGHGFDPIFKPDGYDQTFGEMDRWTKNSISHRAVAIKQLIANGLA
ncbi:MAG: non-canonical purine NTP pyrophosphatase [Aestuariivita sp.]|nr:non-canonical purine NTP pyrophosphatase [Aestuariivita sp.]